MQRKLRLSLKVTYGSSREMLPVPSWENHQGQRCPFPRAETLTLPHICQAPQRTPGTLLTKWCWEKCRCQLLTGQPDVPVFQCSGGDHVRRSRGESPQTAHSRRSLCICQLLRGSQDKVDDCIHTACGGAFLNVSHVLRDTKHGRCPFPLPPPFFRRFLNMTLCQAPRQELGIQKYLLGSFSLPGAWSQ